MKKITLLIFILLAMLTDAQALSFSTIVKTAKLVNTKKGKSAWASKNKMKETFEKRNEEIRSFNAYMKRKIGQGFKPKKEFKFNTFIRFTYATSLMFQTFPKRVIWYSTKGPKGQPRLIGFSKKTGMVIIFNKEMKIVTSYISNVNKLSKRAKNGKIKFIRKKEAIVLIKKYQNNAKYKALIISQGLYVSGWLFF